MVGGATNQPPQLTPLAPPPPSSATTMTEEDEFLKRNTDCVYFLASPLTCKKGSECEYRHSDIARVNPRDCWYWLNGNCLNPKCAFRHPPLDGLLGAEVPTPVAHSIPQVPVTPAKQGVACIFFQKGFCLKGHHCPFLHGPPTVVNNKPVQPVPPNSVSEPSKMACAGPEKFIQEQNLTQQETIQKPVKSLPPQGKYAPEMQASNGGAFVMEKKVAPPPPEEPPRYRSANVGPPPVMSEFPVSRTNHGVYETNHVSDNEGINGKDADEYSREPTPGFDVLVDTEVGDSEYYSNEEQFGRSRGQDFDMDRSIDYDVNQDMYPEQREYDHYNKEGYAWDDHRDSYNFGRKRYHRDDSPDQFDQSDLRHRISKQRRGNDAGGLRSVINREHPRDIHADWIPRRDSHHDHQHLRLEPALSSRLRGRIKIPGRSTSPGNGNESRVEREFDMGRQHRSRYSPGRPPRVSLNHSRLRDRIKGNDYNHEKRNYSGSRGSDSDTEFTGPRRLSELKNQQTDDDQSLGKRKYPRTESQQSEVNLSFEGPKPLSEILKQKRGSVICVVNNDSNSNINNLKDINEKSMDGQASLNNEVNDLQNKVGSIDVDTMLDQELESDDHRDGDYYYDEQIDGEEYNLEEGEEYIYEEEGDETGKKENEVYT